MANQKDVAMVVAKLRAAFPNWKYDELTVQVYFEDLRDLEPELLKAAADKARTKPGREFAPSTGEIRGVASELLRRRMSIPSGLEAWNEVCRAPKPRTSPLMKGGEFVDDEPYMWSHPFVGKVAVMFGWPDFPKISKGGFENEGLDRAHFIKQYESELSGLLEKEIELPNVSNYIESGPLPEIKLLAQGMKK